VEFLARTARRYLLLGPSWLVAFDFGRPQQNFTAKSSLIHRRGNSIVFVKIVLCGGNCFFYCGRRETRRRGGDDGRRDDGTMGQLGISGARRVLMAVNMLMGIVAGCIGVDTDRQRRGQESVDGGEYADGHRSGMHWCGY
jgi:hypothetical protein